MARLLVVLHVGTNTLEATPEHPLWVVSQGWKAADQIQIGDELWTWGGQRRVISGIEQRQGRFTVYNFEVEDWYSYFVGSEFAFAHNGCKVNTPGGKYLDDYATKATKNWSATFDTEAEARALARTKLGSNPVEIEPGKFRSRDGKWQYRAKPGDVADNR